MRKARSGKAPDVRSDHAVGFGSIVCKSCDSVVAYTAEDGQPKACRMCGDVFPEPETLNSYKLKRTRIGRGRTQERKDARRDSYIARTIGGQLEHRDTRERG